MNANFTPPKISCYLTSMSCCAGVKMFEIPIYFALQVWPYFPKMYGRCQKPNTFFENCNRVFFTHEVKRHLPKKTFHNASVLQFYATSPFLQFFNTDFIQVIAASQEEHGSLDERYGSFSHRVIDS